MNSIKGTAAYWKTFLNEFLVMVKRLGLPTLNLTLFCADLRWNELVSLVFKIIINNLNLSEEEVQNLPYQERCKFFNMNPVLVAWHFQFRVDVFFKEILVDGPL